MIPNLNYDSVITAFCQSASAEISGNTETHRQHGKCWKNKMAVLWKTAGVEWKVRRWAG